MISSIPIVSRTSRKQVPSSFDSRTFYAAWQFFYRFGRIIIIQRRDARLPFFARLIWMRRLDFWYTLDLKWKIMPGLDSHVSWNKVTSAGLSPPPLYLPARTIPVRRNTCAGIYMALVAGSPSYSTCMKLINVRRIGLWFLFSWTVFLKIGKGRLETSKETCVLINQTNEQIQYQFFFFLKKREKNRRGR